MADLGAGLVEMATVDDAALGGRGSVETDDEGKPATRPAVVVPALVPDKVFSAPHVAPSKTRASPSAGIRVLRRWPAEVVSDDLATPFVSTIVEHLPSRSIDLATWPAPEA
jgi:hypothetical protein